MNISGSYYKYNEYGIRDLLSQYGNDVMFKDGKFKAKLNPSLTAVMLESIQYVLKSVW